MRICFLAIVCLFAAATNSSAADVRPNISIQPLSQAASPGSTVTFTIAASGTPPLRTQWRFNGMDLEGGTNVVLVLTNLQAAQAGGYAAVVTNNAGAVTSQDARLQIVSGFTRVTNSTLARGGTRPLGAAWGDFNNDGWVDLVAASAERYLIYTNLGDGTFQTVTNRILGGEVNGGRTGMAWADFDNDGHLDLAMGGDFTIANTSLYLYRNRGDGHFTRLATNIFLTSNLIQYSTAWGDYDSDGFVDLVIPTASSGGAGGANDIVFHNNGDGTFARVTNILIGQDNDADQGATWADFDNDGDLDWFATGRIRNHLYRNQGGGNFIQLTNSPVSMDGNISGGCAWGDYDNDGDLDLFVTNFGRDAWLYRNDDGSNFTRVTNSIVSRDGPSAGCLWLDFDNDGWLDLVTPGPRNLLYHNTGDGEFLKVTSGPIVGQAITSWGNNSFASADANRDGFADLLWVDWDGNSQFFQNDGNSNAWLSVRCDGRLSNRAGIGVKARVKATIGGREIWQLREIGGGGLVFTQNEPVAHFGLGDATNAGVVRIEWPSGIVQELRHVAARQFLTVIEPDARITPPHVDAEAGAKVTFTLSTTLPPPVIFQWRRNGVALADETNSTLVISNTQMQHGGSYTVTVSGLEAETTFDTPPALLTGPVVITQQPTSKNVRPGTSATFSVAASGREPLTYQWRFNGANISDATNNSLLFTNCQMVNDGVYDVAVVNSFGPVVSTPAKLGLLINPAFEQHPLSQSVVLGGSVTLSVSVTGSPAPFTFEWRRGSAGIWTNVTSEPMSFLTLTNVLTNHAGNYRVVAKNAASPQPGIISSNALVTVLADTDGDGLPDEWEIAQRVTEAAGDPDGDGANNRNEFVAGTDPRDPQSVLRIENVRYDLGNEWALRFVAVSNRTYSLQKRTHLGEGDRWTSIRDVLAAPTNRVVELRGSPGGDLYQQHFRMLTPRAP